MYTTLKFVHVMGAIVWMGSTVALVSATVGMLRSRDYAGAAALGRQSGRLSTRLFAPSAIVTLVAGVAMVVVGELSFASAWIVIGLAGVFASFVFGAVLGERAEERLREALASPGPVADAAPADGPAADRTTQNVVVDVRAVDAARRRLVAVSTADLAVLTLVVWAMVVKPGL